jgi:hypothetical protein
VGTVNCGHGLLGCAVAWALALGSLAAAQPTFTTILVRDQVPLDLAPRPPNIMSEGDIFVTRMALSPAARQRLAKGLGHEFLWTVDPQAPGPAILSGNEWARIPGDRRLRIEIEADIALHVLGHGASVEESIAAARDEPMPRGILVGVDPQAEPPAGWKRVGGAPARPVVWTRLVDVHGDRDEGGGRALTILDDWPWQTAEHERRWRAIEAANQMEACGPFPHALRAITSDPDGNVYWSWTDRIVKTDRSGKVLAQARVEQAGDLTWCGGRVVVAVGPSGTDTPANWAHAFDDQRLELALKLPLPQVRGRVGGLCWAKDRYVVVDVALGEAQPAEDTLVHEYDARFRYSRSTRLTGGWPGQRLETAEFGYGRFWFGCPGRGTLVASPDLVHVQRCEHGPGGWHGVAAGQLGILLLGQDEARPDGHRGRLVNAHPGAFRR